MIELKNVCLKVVKDKYTLYDINLSFEKGHVYEIVGDHLSSKNILLRVIAGLVPCSKGQVLWNNQNVECIPLKDRKMGYLDTLVTFFKNKSAFDNLYYILKIRKIRKKQATILIDDCLKKYRLFHLKDKKVKQLSYIDKIKIACVRLKLVSRSILLVEDIWEGLTDEEIKDCLTILKETCPTILLASSQPRVEGSDIIHLKWGNVISHEQGKRDKTDSNGII